MWVNSDPSPHPRYRLLDQIGKGGMGEVFRAHDRLTGQVVALKRVCLPLPSALAEPLVDGFGKVRLGEAATLGPEALLVTQAAAFAKDETSAPPLPDAGEERPASPELHSLRLHLAQEFRTLAGLRHPHIVSVLDYGFDRSQKPYFTMELLEGGKPLDEAARGLPDSERVGLLLQILQALTYLHRRGVLHRDLKPGNILVTPGPRGPQVRLLDFGLALFTLDLDTQRSELAGTLGYLAPELFVGAPASAASDLFAVGVMAHELLLGAHPLGALPTAELVSAFLTPRHFFSADERLSKELSAVLRRALSPSPSGRYFDAAAFASELAQATGLSPPPETIDIRESFLQAAHFQAREVEMELLLSALREAGSGHGHVILLGGESGVGKSRLLDEFRAQALVSGARVLRGQAVSEGGGAFLVLRNVLAPLCLEQPLDDLWCGVLLPLIPRLPEFVERSVLPAPDLDAKSTQDRALAVIEDVLLSATLGSTSPLVVLLEDLQWAGSEVLLLLARLSEVSKRHRLLVLGTYRDDERPELPAVIPQAKIHKLNRFSKESVARMAIAMLGTAGERGEVVERLYQETAGNAFFIVEILRALAADAGQLAAVGASALPAHIVAGGVRAVLENRLGRVPAWVLPLLERAAVAGRQLDLRILGSLDATIPHSTAALQAWLAVGANLAILEVSEEGWRFSHDKLRDYILERVARRGHLPKAHREVAEAIERAYGEAERDSQAAALAFHFAEAGDAAHAARYGLQAGERSLSSGALIEAVEQLTIALRYQADCATEPIAGVLARRLLCTALYALGRMEECVEMFRELFAYVGNPLPRHAAGRVLAVVRVLASYAFSRVSATHRLAPELTPSLVYEVELAAMHAGFAFAFSGAQADLIVSSLFLFVTTKQNGSDRSDDLYAGAAGYLRSLLPLGPLHRRGPLALPDRGAGFDEMHSLRRLTSCAVNIGWGYWEWALANTVRGSKEAAAAGNFQQQMYFDMSLMLSFLYQGNFDRARAKAVALLETAARHKNLLFENWSLMCLASLDLSESRTEPALAQSQDLYARAKKIGDVLNLQNAMGLMAQAALQLGDKAAARHWAEQALRAAAVILLPGYGGFVGYLAPAEVLCLLATTETEQHARRTLIPLAGTALTKAWHYAMTFPIGQPRANLVTGMYARMRGQERLARRFFQRALAAAQALSMADEVARAQSVLAS